MSDQIRASLSLSFRTTMAMATVICLALAQSSCEKPMAGTDSYTCRDRKIDVDPNAPNGVVQDPVVVCGGHKIKWKEKNSNDTWEVTFTTSPFTKGETTIKKGGLDASAVLSPNDDTAFKYSIVVNNVKHDPQIIIMGK
jgi:hypothetical protein